MAESRSARLNLPRWTAGLDTLNRGELDGAMAELEARAAGFGHGQLDARPAAAAANAGYIYVVNSAAGTVPGVVGAAYYSDGATWHHINPRRAIRIPHTWHVPGEVKVASGDTDYIAPMFVDVQGGQTVTAIKALFGINSGTSATFTLRRRLYADNTTVDIVAGVVANANRAASNFADVALADGDRVELVVTAVSGTPRNLYVTLINEYLPG